MKRFIWLGCLSYLVIGMAHVVVGGVLQPVLQRYGLDYHQGGIWIMNQFLGFMVGVLCGPWITQRMGRRNALLLSFSSLTAAETAYSFLLPWGWMLAVGPLAGFGFGLIETVVGSTIIEFAEEQKTRAMTRVETFFGIGALLMPALSSLLISEGYWRYTFPLLAVISLVSMLLWRKLTFGSVDALLDAAPKQAKEVRKQVQRVKYAKSHFPLLAVGILSFMVYVGMEMSFSNYLPSIMSERTGLNMAASATTMSLFWGTMVVGRMFAGRIAERSGYIRYLTVSILGGLVMYVLMTVVRNAFWNWIFIGVDGLAWSGVFSIMLLYINHYIPRMTERTTSLMVACGGLGGLIFPEVTGWLMDRYSADAALWLMTGLAGVTLLLALFMHMYNRRAEVSVYTAAEATARID